MNNIDPNRRTIEKMHIREALSVSKEFVLKAMGRSEVKAMTALASENLASIMNKLKRRLPVAWQRLNVFMSWMRDNFFAYVGLTLNDNRSSERSEGLPPIAIVERYMGESKILRRDGGEVSVLESHIESGTLLESVAHVSSQEVKRRIREFWDSVMIADLFLTDTEPKSLKKLADIHVDPGTIKELYARVMTDASGHKVADGTQMSIEDDGHGEGRQDQYDPKRRRV